MRFGEQLKSLPGLDLEASPALHKREPVIMTSHQSDMLRTHPVLSKLVNMAAETYDVCRGRVLRWYEEGALPASVQDDIEIAWPDTHDNAGMPYKPKRFKSGSVYRA